MHPDDVIAESYARENPPPGAGTLAPDVVDGFDSLDLVTSETDPFYNNETELSSDEDSDEEAEEML